jgi:hypothetical protein
LKQSEPILFAFESVQSVFILFGRARRRRTQFERQTAEAVLADPMLGEEVMAAQPEDIAIDLRTRVLEEKYNDTIVLGLLGTGTSCRSRLG